MKFEVAGKNNFMLVIHVYTDLTSLALTVFFDSVRRIPVLNVERLAVLLWIRSANSVCFAVKTAMDSERIFL